MSGEDESAPQVGAEAVARILDQAETVTTASAPTKPYKPGTILNINRAITELLVSYQIVTDPAGTVFVYRNGSWQPETETTLKGLVRGIFRRANATTLRNIIDVLKAETVDRNLAWARTAEYEVPCLDGVLDIRTMKLRPHNARDYLERILPVKWDPAAECPTWMRALAYWFPEDVDGGRSGALQEFFGYLVMPHAQYKKALVLYGESDTGKSVPPLVAKALVGEQATCSLSVEDMDDVVRRAVLRGKALNVITELSADALIADGGFKTLVSTEEPVMIENKYKDAVQYTPTAKHVIATNVLPLINDSTKGTFNRLLIINFDRVLPAAAQDRELLKKLKAELPGILRWAIEGAARLYARGGQWPEVVAAAELLSNYREELNPAIQFVRAHMVQRKGALVSLEAFAQRFNQKSGPRGALGKKQLGKLLRSAGIEVDKARYGKQTIACLFDWIWAPKVPEVMYQLGKAAADGIVVGTEDEAAAGTTADDDAVAQAMELKDE